MQTLGEIHKADSIRGTMIDGDMPVARNMSAFPMPAENAAAAHRVQADFARKLKSAGRDTKQAIMEAKLLMRYLERRVQDAQAEGRQTSIEQEAGRLDIRFGKSAPEQYGNVLNQALRAGIDLDEKIPVVDLSGAGNETLTSKALFMKLRSQLDKSLGITADSEADIHARNRGRRKLLKHIAYSSLKKMPRKLWAQRNKITGSIQDLIPHAVLVETSPVTKPGKDNVIAYHRFYVPVQANGTFHVVRIVAEENKKSSGMMPLDVDLYDVILENSGSAMSHLASPKRSIHSDSFASGGRVSGETAPQKSAREITIRDMLRGVKGMDGQKYAQSAWHGSPYRFDAFDLGEVGSGEGAQAHGWGLYFAEDRNVAAGYREKLEDLVEQADLDHDAIGEYKARYGEGTPEREALETVLEDFRNFGGEEEGQSSFAVYEATGDDVRIRKRDVEERIVSLENWKEMGESIGEDALGELKAELKQIELEEATLDEFEHQCHEVAPNISHVP